MFKMCRIVQHLLLRLHLTVFPFWSLKGVQLRQKLSCCIEGKRTRCTSSRLGKCKYKDTNKYTHEYICKNTHNLYIPLLYCLGTLAGNLEEFLKMSVWIGEGSLTKKSWKMEKEKAE